MRYAKLCQRLATDQNRYRAMSEKKRRTFHGRFIARRIRKTTTRLRAMEKAIGVYHGSVGEYPPPQQ
jgi:hypothetical protein